MDPATPIEAMREMNSLMPNSVLYENLFSGHGVIREKTDCSLNLIEMLVSGVALPIIQKVSLQKECQSPPAAAF